MKRLGTQHPLLFCAAAALLTVAVGAPAEFHVSTSGNDNSDGRTASSAFATVKRAVSALLSSPLPDGGARVWIHQGTYDMSNYTIALDKKTLNSSAVRPVLFSSVSGENPPVFVGGKRLDVGAFRNLDEVKDAAVWGRFVVKNARSSIMVTDMADQGIRDFGKMIKRGGSVEGTSVPTELFCSGKRLPLGRWPNVGVTEPPKDPAGSTVTLRSWGASPDVSGDYTEMGTQDGKPWYQRVGLVGGKQYYLYRVTRTVNQLIHTAWYVSTVAARTVPGSSAPFWMAYRLGLSGSFTPQEGLTNAFGVLYTDSPRAITKGYTFVRSINGAEKTATQFQYEGTRPSLWANATDPFFKGYWYFLWSDKAFPGTIDTKTSTVSFKEVPSYGIRPNQPWYGFNLLEEIDTPGEWYLDRTTGKLYLMPVGDFGDCWMSTSTVPFVTLNGVSNVEFHGIDFSYTRAINMVRIDGGSNNSFTGCIFKHSGYRVASVSGKYNGISGCDMNDVAANAISVTGGVRATLEEGGNYVIDTHVWDFSVIDRTYSPAVSVNGCGNIVRNNDFHDSPHTSLLFSGNEHKIEYNHIHDVGLEASDTGAIYSGRDWSWRNNMIRFNFIHDVPGFDNESYVQAVYIDDTMSGNTVASNVIYRIHGYATMDSGGRDNKFRNNLIIDANCATQTDTRGHGIKNITGDSFNILERLRADGVKYQEEPWKSRYPELAAVPNNYAELMSGNWTNPEGCVFSCNALWKNRGYLCGNGFNYYEEIANNFQGDPMLADEAKLDMNLRADSPVLKMACWSKIPFDSIGLLTARPVPADPSDNKFTSGAVAPTASFLAMAVAFAFAVVL